jgi:hypothetical protein
MKATLEVAALLAIALLLILGAVLTSGTQTVSPALSELRVREGDSLWSLAASHPVEGLTTAQVADLVTKTNGLDSSSIVRGQVILVPSASPDVRLAVR